jgi:hypothetical protein
VLSSVVCGGVCIVGDSADLIMSEVDVIGGCLWLYVCASRSPEPRRPKYANDEVARSLGQSREYSKRVAGKAYSLCSYCWSS